MKISNPYIVGNPIEDRNLFFGREDDFAYISNKVTGQDKGGLLVLCGSRRSGKTSILFQVKGGRLGEAFVPVLIDMQAMVVDSDADFLAELVDGLVKAVDRPDLELEAAYRQCVEARGGNAHKAFQDFVTRLREPLAGRKIVLMFDEYELFEAHIRKDRFSTDILHLLANWMEHRDGVFIVFTGSDKLDERRPGFWEHFLGKARHRRISFLSRGDTFRLVEVPVAGQVTYEEGCLEEIWRITAGQPFYTQVVCQALVDRLNEHDSHAVTGEDIAGVLAEIVENPLPQMVFTWSALSPEEKLTLALIAELTPDADTFVDAERLLAFAESEGIRCAGPALHEALETLFHKDMLSKQTDETTYRFRMDLWRRWIARMHSIWQVVNELGLTPARKGGGARRTLAVLAAAVVIVPLAVFGVLKFRGGEAPEVARSPAGASSRETDVQPEAMLVTVTSEPAGANVDIGGVDAGTTPLINYQVEQDSLVVNVVKRGYVTEVRQLVLGDDALGHLHFDLRILPGRLRVESRPAGATVLAAADDGSTHRGTTPCTFEDVEPSARYRVSIRHERYREANRVVRVSPDSLSTVAADLVLEEHAIMISSAPRASVSLAETVLGETPFRFDRPAGRYHLAFAAAGYETVTAVLDLPGEETFHVDLPPLAPGVLVIKLRPYGDVVVDGEALGQDKVYLATELAAGEHSVVLRNAIYDTREMAVTITPGDTLEVRHDFRDEGGRP